MQFCLMVNLVYAAVCQSLQRQHKRVRLAPTIIISGFYRAHHGTATFLVYAYAFSLSSIKLHLPLVDQANSLLPLR